MAVDWSRVKNILNSGSKDLKEVVNYSSLLHAFTGASSSGAMALTSYSRGVQAIAEAVAQVRFEEFKKTDGYSYRVAGEIDYLLNVAPNNYQNAFDFWRMSTEIILYTGNCFIKINRDSNGTPKSLEILRRNQRPQALLANVGTKTEPNNQLFWLFEDNIESAVPDRDVIHLKINGSDVDMLGNDPLVQYANTIQLSSNSERYANNIYEKNGNISVVLTTDGVLDESQANRLRASWAGRYGGADGDATVILEEGMDVKPIQITPDQAKFLENRKFQIQEVARILGVPTPILMDYSDYNYNTAETADLDFYKRAISPKIDMIEKELTRKLLTKKSIMKGKTITGDVRPLFRVDMETRMKYLQDRFSVGSITPNEIRVAEGDEPKMGEPAMDKTYIMSNLAPADKIESFYDKGEKIDSEDPIEEDGKDIVE